MLNRFFVHETLVGLRIRQKHHQLWKFQELGRLSNLLRWQKISSSSIQRQQQTNKNSLQIKIQIFDSNSNHKWRLVRLKIYSRLPFIKFCVSKSNSVRYQQKINLKVWIHLPAKLLSKLSAYFHEKKEKKNSWNYKTGNSKTAKTLKTDWRTAKQKSLALAISRCVRKSELVELFFGCLKWKLPSIFHLESKL